MSPFYGRVQATNDDVVLDVGCGTGDALNYLKGFARYEGLDTDEVAIGFARAQFGQRAGVTFRCQRCEVADVEAIMPTRVLLCGLLHHLSDEQALDLLASLRASSRLQRIVTSDIVFLEGEYVSNFLARLDRGKFCRERAGFEDLVRRSGLRVVESAIVRSHPQRGLAKYLMMTIEP